VHEYETVGSLPTTTRRIASLEHCVSPSCLESPTMALARMNGLRLEYATVKDAEAIAPLFSASFHDHAYFRRMVPDTADSRFAWAEVFRFACNDPYTICLKVTDEDTGKIVSHGRWVKPKERVEDEQPGHEEQRWSALDPYMDAETAEALFGAFERNRQDMMGQR
jgi:hypothetical protein